MTDYDQIERKNLAKEIEKEIQDMDHEVETQIADPEMEETPKKVIKGVRKKRNLLERGVDLLMGSSGIKSIIRSVADDVIVPSIKDITYEVINSTADRMIYRGDRRSYSPRYDNRGYRGGYAPARQQRDYTKSYSSTEQGRRYERHSRIEPVVFTTNRDALDVLAELNDEIKHNGFVRVADFYNMTNYDNIQAIDNFFGWEDVRGCEIRHKRDGWYLYMTDPVSLDN